MFGSTLRLFTNKACLRRLDDSHGTRRLSAELTEGHPATTLVTWVRAGVVAGRASGRGHSDGRPSAVLLDWYVMGWRQVGVAAMLLVLPSCIEDDSSANPALPTTEGSAVVEVPTTEALPLEPNWYSRFEMRVEEFRASEVFAGDGHVADVYVDYRTGTLVARLDVRTPGDEEGTTVRVEDVEELGRLGWELTQRAAGFWAPEVMGEWDLNHDLS